MNYEDNELCYQRLISDYKEHGKLIIAFDFDNTIYDYHRQGLSMKKTIEAIKLAHALGNEVYCFTANNNEKFVKEYCKLVLGFEPDINKSSIDHYFESRKPFYSLLLDDRAGLSNSLSLLIRINNYIVDKRIS